MRYFHKTVAFGNHAMLSIKDKDLLRRSYLLAICKDGKREDHFFQSFAAAERAFYGTIAESVLTESESIVATLFDKEAFSVDPRGILMNYWAAQKDFFRDARCDSLLNK